jgi:holo-[acyl-carrier protein] synthase
MPILGVGVDLMDVGRFEREMSRGDPAFPGSILLPAEIERSRKDPHPPASMAACFAAKEAFLKALGTGRAAGITWHDIEVVAAGRRKPALLLGGEAGARAAELGVIDVSLSLSTGADCAAAVVLLRGRGAGDGPAEAEATW